MFAKRDRNGRAYAEVTFDRKLRADDGANMLDDSKTESRAADTLGMRLVDTVEALAKSRQVFLFDTNARIPDLQAYAFVSVCYTNRNGAAVLVVLNGVGNQIFNQLIDHIMVG